MAYQQLTLDHVVTAATGFKGPEGVTVDREGNIYGGGTDGVIRKLSPDGTVTEFARTGGRPASMARESLIVRRSHEHRNPGLCVSRG